MAEYYIPSIEEFHVGFEVQLFSGEHAQWGTYKITVDDFLDTTIADFQNELEHQDEPGIRVKYLDKEDIESLGFKENKAVNNVANFHYTKEYPCTGHINPKIKTANLIISFPTGPHMLAIWWRGDPESAAWVNKYNGLPVLCSEKIFDGQVKNKSEFIRIVRQLRLN